jgi:hypothetical protein
MLLFGFFQLGGRERFDNRPEKAVLVAFHDPAPSRSSVVKIH